MTTIVNERRMTAYVTEKSPEEIDALYERYAHGRETESDLRWIRGVRVLLLRGEKPSMKDGPFGESPWCNWRNISSISQ